MVELLIDQLLKAMVIEYNSQVWVLCTVARGKLMCLFGQPSLNK